MSGSFALRVAHYPVAVKGLRSRALPYRFVCVRLEMIGSPRWSSKTTEPLSPLTQQDSNSCNASRTFGFRSGGSGRYCGAWLSGLLWVRDDDFACLAPHGDGRRERP